MKYLSFAVLLALFSPNLLASAPIANSAELVKAPQVVSKRLASKEISEVIEIVLRLQMECQREINEDVCKGVLNVLAVLQERVANMSGVADKKTIAFIEGLVEGVYDANQSILAQLSQQTS